MFSANNLSSVVENAVKSNNVVNVDEADKSRITLVSLLVALLIVLVLNLVLGPWLWNNVVRSLVPGLGKARWFDTVALSVLLSLVIPH